MSEDRLTIARGSKRSKTPLYEIENSVPIPIDLIIEILWRLPAKSIGRCRCVSKRWATMLRRPYFTELYFARSSARPQILFTTLKDGELFFFSSPQNPDENSSLLAASYIMKIPLNDNYEICGHVCGLFCIAHMGTEETLRVIYNPTTRQTLNLPNVMGIGVRNYFGYEPIEKQFKILVFMSRTRKEAMVPEDLQVQVLTLGTRELSLRMIECSIPHFPLCKGVCINGLLYYRAALKRFSQGSYYMIICFDLRSEKFKLITSTRAVITSTRAVSLGTLINYNGKLGSLVSEEGFCILTERSRSIHLWVLQDAEKNEWLEHTYVLPTSWKKIVRDTALHFAGVTRTNEIVLSSARQNSVPCYVFYYSMERNTVMRVDIQGIEAHENGMVNIYLDHVEDVKLMQEFQ